MAANFHSTPAVEPSDTQVMAANLHSTPAVEPSDTQVMAAQNSSLVSWTLQVTVLRADNILSADYWSEADSYVTLLLPDVSSQVFRTHIVPNNKNPQWNQTFTFNIKDRVQGDLEVRLYDEDPLMYDDLLWTLKFDVSTLSVGEKTTKMFGVDPQGKLWLDFHLQKRVNNPVSRPQDLHLKNLHSTPAVEPSDTQVMAANLHSTPAVEPSDTQVMAANLHSTPAVEPSDTQVMAAQNSSLVSWTLQVTVLRADNILSADYWSEADSYVTLHLPDVSSRVFRTHIVPNNKNPQWNQTFTFNIKDRVQGDLELRLYDEDPLMYDNLLWTLKFDVSTLSVGEKTTKMFGVDPQGKLWLDFHLQKRVNNPVSRPQDLHLKKEVVSFQTLNVTVVRANIPDSKDFYSESDCYVILSLPTATARRFRTKTVYNTGDPVWNETVSFRVPELVKSVLEIQLYDEDLLKRGDHISTLLFDVSNLTVGQKEAKVFNLDAEVNKTLELDLELLQSDDPPSEYLSNGIVMAAPLVSLEISSEQLQRHRDKVFQVRGAYQEVHRVSSKLRYHINRDLDTEFGVTPASEHPAVALQSAVPLKLIPPKYTATVSMVIDEETVDLDLETHESSEEEFLAVRVDTDIPRQEKDFLEKRKLLISQALQKLFGPEAVADPDELPTIAVVASGGGSRAMTGLLGHLKALQDIGLLDAVTYITGVSGSTWAMASLYQEASWSQKKLSDLIAEIKKQMTKSFMGLFSSEKLYYYREELAAKRDCGLHVSVIDLAALMLENLVFGNKTIGLLSDQQKTVSGGQNPLPIYTAINVRDGIETEAEWCEFTPYEVGIPKYGAYVQTENFGSQFFLGHIVKKLPEIRFPYLLGIFSSAISINLARVWEHVTGSDPTSQVPDISNIEVDTRTPALDTVYIKSMSYIGSMLSKFLKIRPAVAEAFNYLRGLVLHKDYSKHRNFQAWKETHPDAFPNRLTPNDPTLQLVDSGLDINIGCVPILRPERDVDLILSLSNSWDPQQIFKVMRRTAEYCKDHNIPFPSVDFDSLEEGPQQELYVLEDEENPDAPVVIHLPLVNVSYKHFKSPGVKRETEEELQAGQVDVSTSESPYTSLNFTYSPQDYDALVQLVSYNMLNNRQKILETVKRVMEKKRSKRRR